MEETTSYPPIEPSDLIMIGTGLPETIIAAADTSAGKTVLQLDPNSFYGTRPSLLHHSEDDASTPLLSRSLYSKLEISSRSPEPIENRRKFNLDLSGTRVLLCSDFMIDLILKTGINQYIEFKSVDESFVLDAKGNLASVPDSRNAIFRDSLNPTQKIRLEDLLEKHKLMKFFKLVQGHVAEESGEAGRISEEDSESPLFMSKKELSQKQNSFSNANGAMIYPIYGHGELPQAFCRLATVKGCIHVENSHSVGLGDGNLKVARGICIGNNSVEGKKMLNAAINALLSIPTSRNSVNNGFNHSSIGKDTKTSLLWSALYLQELTVNQEAFDSISYTWTPDQHLDCNNLLASTEKLFKEIYPDEEFFPPTSSSD